ncbi:MAG: hypothetical protein IKU61_06655 [Clostridia bacterium]|nr:hypothetical protein [Clostridia bacterium]
MKIKKSFGRRFATFLTVILTFSMLLLAAIYIGGTQFASESAAINLDKKTDGTVTVGGIYDVNIPVYEKGLLPVSFAAISYGGEGGGAYGSDDSAKALSSFAAEPLHACLESGASFKEINKDAFLFAASGDFLYLDFLSSLPYQMIYALTGENLSPARYEEAINVDRVFILFPTGEKAMLYFSDGERFFASDAVAEVHRSELSALAGDSRLSSFTINEFGVPSSIAPVMLPHLTLKAETDFSDSETAEIFSLLGFDFNPQSASDTAVATHGTLKLTPTRLVFAASMDGGIPVSDFLDAPKNPLDINIYDILLGGSTLCEKLIGTSRQVFGGANLYLENFYRTDDVYTLTFGACSDSVRIYGNALPFFAKITVQGGRFRSIETRFLQVEKDSFAYPLFSSAWQYSHASENAEIRTLRPMYRAMLLPEKDLAPAWFCTGEKTGGERS